MFHHLLWQKIDLLEWYLKEKLAKSSMDGFSKIFFESFANRASLLMQVYLLPLLLYRIQLSEAVLNSVFGGTVSVCAHVCISYCLRKLTFKSDI